MLYNAIYKSTLVTHTLGANWECLAVFCAKMLTFFLKFISYRSFWLGL